MFVGYFWCIWCIFLGGFEGKFWVFFWVFGLLMFGNFLVYLWNILGYFWSIFNVFLLSVLLAEDHGPHPWDTVLWIYLIFSRDYVNLQAIHIFGGWWASLISCCWDFVMKKHQPKCYQLPTSIKQSTKNYQNRNSRKYKNTTQNIYFTDRQRACSKFCPVECCRKVTCVL